MIYLGIDVASEKHDCCIMNQGKQVLSAFSFANSAEGFGSLLRKAKQFDSPENIRVGLEATGIYGTNLTEFLRRNGIQVTTLNPLLIKTALKAPLSEKQKQIRQMQNTLHPFLCRRLLSPTCLYHITILS